MDFIEFCEKVLGYYLYDRQKTYLTEMYDMVKKAKEENREINFIKSGRGSSKYIIHLTALLLINEYERYLKGERNE